MTFGQMCGGAERYKGKPSQLEAASVNNGKSKVKWF